MIATSEKERKIINSLYQLERWKKLSNYVLLEVEKNQRHDHVFAYPFWLTIDPSSICSLKCPFCPTGQNRNSREKTIMAFDNFKKIIDELGPYLVHIDFCNWGEPFFNKDIFRMIEYAKQYQIDTKVDTNLTLLDEGSAENLILSGLDKLIVSIDGLTEQTYSQYRIGGNFNQVISNLRLLLKKRNELKRDNPYISWQFLVFRHNEHEIEGVKEKAKELGVDHVGITKAFIGNKEWIPQNRIYSNYDLDKLNGSGEKIKLTSDFFNHPETLFCDWLWEGITVNANGSVSPCCSVEDEKDDFGNIFSTSFKEIWNNQAYKSARRYIKERKMDSVENHNICFNCKHSGSINFDLLSCHSLFK